MANIEDHFRKLYARYGVGQDMPVQVQQIAELFDCSIRNARITLTRMQQENWIEWQPQRGRGKQSILRLLIAPDTLINQNIEQMIAHFDYGNVLKFIGNEKQALNRIIQYRFGAQENNSETRVRIPYYRDIDRLNPLHPLRRTERHLVRQCLSGLTRYDGVQGKIVPDIAHYWTHNEQATRWEFYIKSTAHFSDGERLSAPLLARCLNAASQSPWFAALFSDLSAIYAADEYRLVVETSVSMNRLDCLLATQAALIFDQRDSEMRCSGPFRIQRHQGNFLTLHRNEHYHQARPMLNEINIFTWAPESISMSFIPVLHGEQALDTRPLSERQLEKGSCFVLVDNEGLFADDVGRRFLNHVLQPMALLDRTNLPQEYASILSIAQGLLPEWNHRRVDFGNIPLPFTAHRQVSIATFGQPELVELAQAMADILRGHHFQCTVHVYTFEEFTMGNAQSADIWLTNFMLDTLSSPAFLDWLASSPVFRHLPEKAQQDHRALIQHILNEADDVAHQRINEHFHQLTHQRWIIPLLHHWMEFANENSFTWRDLSTLGWPDFSQLWL